MKIVRYELPNQEQEFGVVQGNTIYPLANNIFSPQIEINDTRALPIETVKLLAPVRRPSKLICIGMNYTKHAEEMGRPPPAEPMFFFKAPSAIIGPEEMIKIPPWVEGQVHYEAELAVIIKKQCKDVPEKEFMSVVLGYTIMNDVTARHYQQNDPNFSRAKSLDTFAPMGPCIDTTLNPNKVKIQLRLNNEIKQNATTDDMIFKVPALIAYLSKYMTLNPGDVISTGTPPGVGPVKAGDLVEIDAEKIGCLRNYVA
jgi:2-keto-4-pentenoate hydratase/2-oxohepta-3-ene-1,7-dioic acid hydratase in catechol pathway